ncbi:MAG: beta-lactamase family protein [Candidatus Eremiobacteraeota bacterium]|nr:beta-lactamase family protein [Candidatus Eremiobacteraeota bacterium]
MKRKGSLLAAATVALSACGGGAGNAPAPIPAITVSPSTSAYDATIDKTYTDNWGVELAVYKNGQPDYVNGYGLRDRGLPDSFYGPGIWDIPQPDAVLNLPRGKFSPDAGTIFEIGSISKEFTAGAILLLQQDGKLSVNDSVAKYFPGLPGASQMTLVNLLQHSSGYVDYNNFFAYPDFSAAYNAFMQSGQTDYQPIVDRLATFPLQFAPGSQYSYSNSNYLLLGIIVARVSGEPLGDFLEQRIFAPLAMTDTHQGYPPQGTVDFALGYFDNNGTEQRTYQWNLTWLAGPGGITSTVTDLEKWDRAVRSPGLFTPTSLAQMFAPGPYPQSYGTYAFGWFIATLDGHPYIWHDGAIGGFVSMNATFPKDGIDIIVLVNNASAEDPYDIIPSLLQTALTAQSRQSFDKLRMTS